MQLATQWGLVQFVEDGHRYTLNGEPQVGVTTILSDEGLWFNPNANSGNAAIGTALHKGARIVAEGRWDKSKTHPALIPRLEIFEEWLKLFKFRPLLWEQLVYSGLYRYCGILDLLAERDDDPCLYLIDIKSNVPPQYADIQLALYEQAARESGIIAPYRQVKRYTLSLMASVKAARIPPNPGDARSLALGLAAAQLWHFRREKNLLRSKINSGE